jgi:hypothetical protein
MKASWAWCALPLAGGALVVLFFVVGGRAEDKDDGAGKGARGDGPTVIRLDLDRLPPDMAKQLLKYADGIKKDEGPKKATKAGPPDGKKGARALPPGLRDKPADHPGRKARLAGDKKDEPPAKDRKKPGDND